MTTPTYALFDPRTGWRCGACLVTSDVKHEEVIEQQLAGFTCWHCGTQNTIRRNTTYASEFTGEEAT